MFEGNETAAAKSAQGLDWKSKSLKVHHKQMNSTPVDHNANVLHCPPVSSFWILFFAGNVFDSNQLLFNCV